MKSWVCRTADQLQRRGLATAADLVVGAIEETFHFAGATDRVPMAREIMERLDCGAFVSFCPVTPYRDILRFLSESGTDIRPNDSETRTFLHDIPVVSADPEAIAAALRRRRAVVLHGGEIMAVGAVSPEEAAVYGTSVCFAIYVKFMVDTLACLREGTMESSRIPVLERVMSFLTPLSCPPVRCRGPFASISAAMEAMEETGRMVVENDLVDSCFGNISLRHDEVLYISQTGAPLDNLEGCIDPCPLDGPAGTLTASSEFLAHLRIVQQTGCDAVLHGHPKFAVILSLDCEERCSSRICHTDCPAQRSVNGVPIVTGEVGAGANGLFQTVPEALMENDAVIVLGHGLFVRSDMDFASAVRRMFELENACMKTFIRKVTAARKQRS